MVRIAIPAVSEQGRISDFLDRETARIDALVAKQHELIKLLQEKGTALISHTVTKGLDPDVSMKDSGVTWLGEIPAHWEVVPLKRVAWFSGGAGFPVSYQGDGQGNILFAKVSDMNRPGNNHGLYSTANTVTRAIARKLGAHVFPQGTIIFPKVGGALLTNKRRVLVRETCIDNNLMGCVVTGADRDFLFWILRWIDFGRMSKPGTCTSNQRGGSSRSTYALPTSCRTSQDLAHPRP